MRKILLSLLVMSLLLVAVSPLSAQTPPSPPDPCGGLNEADCAALNASFTAMREVGVFNNAFRLNLGGAGGTSAGNTVALEGAGPIRLDADGNAEAIDFSLSAQDQAAAFRVLPEGVFLAAPDASGELAWQGLTLETAGDSAALVRLISQLLSGQLLIESLSQPGVVALQRLADQGRDGQTMLVFEGEVAIANLLATEQILGLLSQLLAQITASNPDALGGLGNLQGADLAGALALLPVLLTQDEITIIQWVGADDGYIHRIEFKVNLALNAAFLNPNLGTLSFQFDLQNDLSDFGGDFTFAAPEDYTPLDTAMFNLDGLLGGVLGGDGPEGEAEAPQSDAERFAVEQTLAIGQTVSGELVENSNEQDVWGFEGRAGQVITITLRALGEGSSLDTVLYLRDDTGAELAFNDDHSDGVGLGLFDSRITAYELPTSGTYRIVATWLTPTRDGAYELTVTAE